MAGGGTPATPQLGGDAPDFAATQLVRRVHGRTFYERKNKTKKIRPARTQYTPQGSQTAPQASYPYQRRGTFFF